MLSLQDVVVTFTNSEVNDLTVGEAKRVFDVFFESICEECMENDLQVPSWHEAFGLWCVGQIS